MQQTTRRHGLLLLLEDGFGMCLSAMDTIQGAGPMKDIVILSGARTAIGTFGGSLAGIPPILLGATAARSALERAGVEGAQIGHVAYGHVINTEPRDMYLSRVAAMEAGIPETTPAMNVNRLCGSGAQAIVSVIQSLAMGDADFGLAGGAESMSRSPHILPTVRWGQKMGDTSGADMMLGALNCPFGTGHMGVTAENVAAEHDIRRGKSEPRGGGDCRWSVRRPDRSD
jgi:acetyl-CoA C-acetyltransferase